MTQVLNHLFQLCLRLHVHAHSRAKCFVKSVDCEGVLHLSLVPSGFHKSIELDTFVDLATLHAGIYMTCMQ